VLPWSSRQELLARLRAVELTDAIVRAFEAAGASRPVTLKPEQKPVLFSVVEAWLVEVDLAGLPAGIFQVRNALHDDLADAHMLCKRAVPGAPSARRGETRVGGVLRIPQAPLERLATPEPHS
jgi:hypothetical protein